MKKTLSPSLSFSLFLFVASGAIFSTNISAVGGGLRIGTKFMKIHLTDVVACFGVIDGKSLNKKFLQNTVCRVKFKGLDHIIFTLGGSITVRLVSSLTG